MRECASKPQPINSTLRLLIYEEITVCWHILYHLIVVNAGDIIDPHFFCDHVVPLCLFGCFFGSIRHGNRGANSLLISWTSFQEKS